MKSLRLSTAQLRKSKLGPRLATVVGTKVLMEANMGSGQVRVCGWVWNSE